ncbi:MAG: thiamine-phosphate kinase [Pseudohongiella sp.]|nr:thiamine-phosphate kinase [Pseudohongiella sp.]MDP2125877.1 thiamine-phosphate kinase [Pseudohongiella sp.]
MAQGEFNLIRRYFAQPALNFKKASVLLGPGDDAAILSIPAGKQLVVSMDTLNESVHFPADADPFLLAQRCLLVNLSDLAAMGAEPLAFTLSISLPEPDENWLEAFSQGLAVVANAYQCPLIGGDTTRGPMSVCIQVHGLVPAGKALLRSGAKSGDAIYVTGELGDAAAALWWLMSDTRLNQRALSRPSEQVLNQAFYQPDARINAGVALRDCASAMLDISDGLASDLRHILRASSTDTNSLGAVLDSRLLPLSDIFRTMVPEQEQIKLALSGGDDYELCVCVPASRETDARAAMAVLGIRFTRVGTVVDCVGIDQAGIQLVDAEGAIKALDWQGYTHFVQGG